MDVFFLRKHTTLCVLCSTHSSSVGLSPPISSVQSSVHEATNKVQQEQRNEDEDAKTRKEEMLKEVILGLLDEQSRWCKEEGEKELLRVATHLIKSNGFKLHKML